MGRASWSLEKNYEVYLLTNRVNGKRYVGKTVYSARHRFAEHKAAKRSACVALLRAANKYGWDAFDMRVLYGGVDEKEIALVERAMIAEYDTFGARGYNLTIGGEGSAGHPVSERVRQAVGATWRGKTLSAEHRAKMSAARRGKKLSPEHAAAISAGKKGRPSRLRGVARPASVASKSWATRRARYGDAGFRA